MRWFEYKAEVDSLHAPEDLKAKLLAMQTQAVQAPAPQKKKPLRFPWKRAAGFAACFVLGAGLCGAAFLGSATGLFRAGSSDVSTAVSRQYSMKAAGGVAEAAEAENGWATDAVTAEAYDTGATASTPSDLSGAGRASSSPAVTERKIIYTAYLYLESKNYEETRAALEQALENVGGYVESCDEYSYTNSARSVTLRLRIPAVSYQSFLAAAAGTGNLCSKSEQAEDITAQYIDVAARIANLEAQRDRLTTLEAQAETLSDLLEIQSNLSDVQYQLESWQSQMNWYNDQVDYCTVTVDLSEVKEYTPPAREGFGERLTGALGDGWTAFVEGTQDFAVWLAYSWPVVLLVAAAACAGVVLWRRRGRKRRQGSGRA